MHQDRPSTTAWAVALRRAVHQLLDHPLVLPDPLALHIVGESAAREAIAREDRHGPLYKKYSRSLRAFVVARSRFAEDRLATAVARGTRQYVLLGAGLDTFAHRNPHPALRVFEVDHPATQAWKRRLLESAGLAPPPNLTFVPVDFERQTLADQLPAAGLDPAAPAFFSWLGVVPYLTLEAFRATVTWLGQCPPGARPATPPTTEVIFDYAIAPEELPFRQRAALTLLKHRVAAAGFTTIEDLAAPHINARYFANRPDALAIAGSIGHLLHATR